MVMSILSRRPSSGLGNIRSSYADPIRNIDWVLMAAVIAQTTIGAFIIYSATRTRLLNRGVDPYFYTQRQIIFVILAAALMAAVMSLDYGRLRANATIFYAAVLFLLVLVLVVGTVRGGARLSFNLGFVAVQPSELSKVATLILLGGYLADGEKESVSYEDFMRSLVIVGIPVGLIMLQPDLGSATVLVASTMGVLLVAGARLRYIVFITSLAIVSAGLAVVGGALRGYQLRRITAFLDQTSDSADLANIISQVNFAKRAVATGGLTGKGYLQGPLTNGAFIPVQSTDFVFSAVGEQFGMIGCGLVLGLLSVILWRIFRIAQMAKDRLGLFIAAGVFTMILWQSFQNIGMTMGITPVSGVPLPFVSYGGSHTVAFALMIGLVQSVHMRRFK